MTKTSHTTTALSRWTDGQRPALFKSVRYSSLATGVLGGIPKVGSQVQADVLTLLLADAKPLAMDSPQTVTFSALASNAPNFPQPCVYVGGTAYNWFPAWRDIPPTSDATGQPSLPARTAGMMCRSEEEANVVFAMLCSSLGYWWWAVASDGFNLKKWLIERFPVSLTSLNAEGRRTLARLGKELRRGLKRNYVYKDNKGRIGNYYLPACEGEIRNIDDALVGHVDRLTSAFMEDIRAFNQSFARLEETAELSGEDE